METKRKPRSGAIRKSTFSNKQNISDSLYGDKSMEELLNQQNFKTGFLESVVSVILNRLPVGKNKINDAKLCNFLRRVSGNDLNEVIEKVSGEKKAEECRVKVTFVEAENLAAKDSDGTSDPYCVCSIVHGDEFVKIYKETYNGKYPVKETGTQQSTLNPRWNEQREFKIKRSDISDYSVQVQIWDQDTEEVQKKVVGFKGFQTLVYSYFKLLPCY